MVSGPAFQAKLGFQSAMPISHPAVCFAFSLALRLLARIVLLDLEVFLTSGTDLNGGRPSTGVPRSRLPRC